MKTILLCMLVVIIFTTIILLIFALTYEKIPCFAKMYYKNNYKNLYDLWCALMSSQDMIEAYTVRDYCNSLTVYTLGLTPDDRQKFIYDKDAFYLVYFGEDEYDYALYHNDKILMCPAHKFFIKELVDKKAHLNFNKDWKKRK